MNYHKKADLLAKHTLLFYYRIFFESNYNLYIRLVQRIHHTIANFVIKVKIKVKIEKI